VLHGILGGAATLALLAAATPARATLDDTVAQLVEQLQSNGSYRHPTPAERDRALAASTGSPPLTPPPPSSCSAKSA
jgi:hypothetical protein